MFNSLLYLTFVLLSYGVIPAFLKTVVVPHTDPSISYLPKTCDLDCHRVCAGEWWLSCLANDGSSHRTKGNNTSANFVFKGSSVTWFTRTGTDGGRATVFVDRVQEAQINTNSPVTQEDWAAFTKSGLDPNVEHMISVVYDIRAFTESIELFVDIHHFEYEDSPVIQPPQPQSSTSNPGEKENISSTTSSSSSTTSSSSSASATGSDSRTRDSSSGGSSNTRSSAPNASDSQTGGMTTPTNSSTKLDPGLDILDGNSSFTADRETETDASTASTHSNMVPAYVGAGLGALALITSLVFIIFYQRKQRRLEQLKQAYPYSGAADPQGEPKAPRPSTMGGAYPFNDPFSQAGGSQGPGLIAMQLSRAKATEAGYGTPITGTTPEFSSDPDHGAFFPTTPRRYEVTPYQRMESGTSLGFSPGQGNHLDLHIPVQPIPLATSPISPAGSGTRMSDDSLSDARRASLAYTESMSPMTPPPRYVPGPNHST